MAPSVKTLPVIQETQVWSLTWGDSLEKEPFFAISLSALIIRVMVVLKNEFGSASPFPIFWKSFKRIRVSSSLSVWQNLPGKSSGAGLLCVGRFFFFSFWCVNFIIICPHNINFLFYHYQLLKWFLRIVVSQLTFWGLFCHKNAFSFYLVKYVILCWISSFKAVRHTYGF